MVILIVKCISCTSVGELGEFFLYCCLVISRHFTIASFSFSVFLFKYVSVGWREGVLEKGEIQLINISL